MRDINSKFFHVVRSLCTPRYFYDTYISRATRKRSLCTPRYFYDTCIISRAAIHQAKRTDQPYQGESIDFVRKFSLISLFFSPHHFFSLFFFPFFTDTSGSVSRRTRIKYHETLIEVILIRCV